MCLRSTGPPRLLLPREHQSRRQALRQQPRSMRTPTAGLCRQSMLSSFHPMEKSMAPIPTSQLHSPRCLATQQTRQYSFIRVRMMSKSLRSIVLVLSESSATPLAILANRIMTMPSPSHSLEVFPLALCQPVTLTPRLQPWPLHRTGSLSTTLTSSTRTI